MGRMSETMHFRGASIMYKSQKNHQIAFDDFNQSCGMQLDMENQWVRLALSMPWGRLEEKYAKMFPSKKGCPAKPLRMALGALIIQKRMNLSDRKLVSAIAENPYCQFFLGLEGFQKKCPFTAPSLVAFRKRLDCSFLKEANELFLATAEATPEHQAKKASRPGERQSQAASATDGDAVPNAGTAILDATCSPSNIKYPQDFELLNTAREKLEKIIDRFHKESHPFGKPRTYRRIARKEYLAMAKAKKRPANKLRKLIRKELGYVLRDLGYIDRYLEAGCRLAEREEALVETIRKLYGQQKYMFDNKTHRVADRIVSLSQPCIRPIVRGKAKSPVEFGAKYDVSIDEKGHARLEKLAFTPYNESTVFQDAIERYRKRTGHYPERALVDRIYRTRENRAYCKERGIRMSGPKLGRPKKEGKPKTTKAEYKDNADRIEVERFFSAEKRVSGGGLIMVKLEETTLAAIALSVLVTNLFAVPTGTLFFLYFMDCRKNLSGSFYFELQEAA